MLKRNKIYAVGLLMFSSEIKEDIN